METLTDTLLNVFVFVFVGVLVWLYFKTSPENDESEDQRSDRA